MKTKTYYSLSQEEIRIAIETYINKTQSNNCSIKIPQFINTQKEPHGEEFEVVKANKDEKGH